MNGAKGLENVGFFKNGWVTPGLPPRLGFRPHRAGVSGACFGPAARVGTALLQPVFHFETFDKCKVGVGRE